MDITGNITVTDNKTGTFNITSSGLKVEKNVTGTANYTVKQQDLTAGSVINSANATVLFDNQLIKSPDTTYTVPAVQQGLPALTLVKSAASTSYDDVGQTITYTYNVTNSGNMDISAPITVTDDKFGTISIQSSGILSPGSSVTGTSTFKIIQADIDNSHVTNSAYATGSFNSQPVISPSAIAIVRYEQPTKKEEHNEEEHIGDRDNYGGPGYGGYGGAVIPMIPGPMYGSEPYGYGGEPYGPTETLNSESNVHKTKAHLSKHKHKNHSKHHKTKKHTTKHHKTGKNNPV